MLACSLARLFAHSSTPDIAHPHHTQFFTITLNKRNACTLLTYIILVNDRVSGDLISISSHFNPYQVSLRRIDTIPRIYVSLLVTTATLHKSMQQDENFVRSSALMQREEDIFRFRIRALRDVNYRLSKKDTQTSDSTLMCVICLLLSTVSGLGQGLPALVLWFLL